MQKFIQKNSKLESKYPDTLLFNKSQVLITQKLVREKKSLARVSKFFHSYLLQIKMFWKLVKSFFISYGNNLIHLAKMREIFKKMNLECSSDFSLESLEN